MRSFIWIVTVEQPRPLTLLTEHMPRKDRTQIFTSLKTPDPFSLSPCRISPLLGAGKPIQGKTEVSNYSGINGGDTKGLMS